MAYSPNYFGQNAKGSSRQTSTGYQNASGGTLVQSTAVSTNTSGKILALDVSDENSVSRVVGLCAADIPNAASGQVIDNGRLENVVTSFAIGDSIYAGKTPGALINTKPDIGSYGFVSGDFVVFIGVIVQNEFNALQKDIKLMISVIGQF